jgi:BirA family biotin operon repressor/biotin-[acetyl-CoA-carboxylase] ligase
MHDPLWQSMRDDGGIAGHPVRFLAATDSTNTVAMALAREGAPPGTLVVAEGQSAGRGRLARQWLSPPGRGLYVSFILRPTLELADLPKITLAAGVALCRAVVRATNVGVRLKWPNDLLLHGKKCGGILAETSGLVGDGPMAVILGIGINVNTPQAFFPAELNDKATSLAATAGREFMRGPLLLALVEEVDDVVRLLEKGGFAEILAAWRQHDGLTDQRLTWITPQGAVVTGISLGPDEDGRLHIRDDAGTVHEVLSGDLTLAAGCSPFWPAVSPTTITRPGRRN